MTSGVYPGRNNWTNEELEILKEYPYLSKKELLIRLPNKDIARIHQKAKNLKIKKTKEAISKSNKEGWTEERTKEWVKRRTGVPCKNFSEEQKERLRTVNIGRKLSESRKKQIRESQLGEKSHCWHGGISKTPYPPECTKALRESIRKRDDDTCQECNYTQEQLGYTLHVHHIDYDKKNNDMSNLITLCKSCHMKTTHNRADWVQYYQEKVRV